MCHNSTSNVDNEANRAYCTITIYAENRESLDDIEETEDFRVQSMLHMDKQARENFVYSWDEHCSTSFKIYSHI